MAGAGFVGLDLAQALRARGIAVTLLVREASWMEFAFPAEESEMINRQIRKNGVDLRLATELDRILPDEHSRVRSAVTKGGDEISCGFLALTVGVVTYAATLAVCWQLLRGTVERLLGASGGSRSSLEQPHEEGR